MCTAHLCLDRTCRCRAWARKEIERQDRRQKVKPADEIIMAFAPPRHQSEGYAPKSAPEQWLINSRRRKLRCLGHTQVRRNANVIQNKRENEHPRCADHACGETNCKVSSNCPRGFVITVLSIRHGDHAASIERLFDDSGDLMRRSLSDPTFW